MYMSKINGITYINYRIRENKRKINIFDKVNTIKKDLKEIIPEIDEDKLLTMFSHLRRKYEGNLHYGRRTNPENHKRKRELTEVEKIIYNYLLKNKLSPSTTYRWFLACRVPSDIKEKLEKGQLSYKVALKISANRKRAKESNVGLLMIEEINNIVESL